MHYLKVETMLQEFDFVFKYQHKHEFVWNFFASLTVE